MQRLQQAMGIMSREWHGEVTLSMQFLQLSEEKWPSQEYLPDNSELSEAQLMRNPPPDTHILLELVSSIVNLEAIIFVSRYSQFDKLWCITAFVLRFVSLLKLSNFKDQDQSRALDRA